jgi:hypothetical protein
MKEFKGTKGGWKNSRNGIVQSENKDAIAVVYSGELNPVLDSEAMEANAKLIAAAPELLEALQAMMCVYKEIADSGDCGWWEAEEQENYKYAMSIINKAL